MKKYLLFLLFAALCGKIKAQAGYNYAEYGLGFGVSYARPFSDLKANYNDYVYNVNANYYYTPYVPVTLEIQFGKLRGGGNTVKEDASTRRFSNNFKAVLLHADLQLGQVIDYQQSFVLNVLKNFYIGSGLGVMLNSVDANRESLIDIGYKFPGSSSSVGLLVPLRVGYELKIYNGYGEPNIRLDFGYQHNIAFGEGMDGYDDPPTKFKNNAVDQYRQFSVGVKLNLWGGAAYGKSISGN